MAPIALVSGAAQGIGFACAQALAEDGYKVVLADVKESVFDSAAKLNGVGMVCDMGDVDAVGTMFDQIEDSHGPVEALVNNAGIAMPGDFLTYDLAAFDTVLGVNLRGLFVATQRAARTMVEKGIEGAIVNMSSINAQVAIPAIPAYCASKGGVMQLTKVAALALAKHNIRVNAVGPGSIDTEMMAGVNANPEAYKMAMSRTPLGRAGSAREIGDVVAFLCSRKSELRDWRDDLCRWRAAWPELCRLMSYAETYARWKADPEDFWGEAAGGIDWFTPAAKVFDPDMGAYGRWFPGATCNTCWNAVDRHVAAGHADRKALIYDSPVTGARAAYHFRDLQAEVGALASVMRDHGVAKGDRVVIYMPMVPEAIFAMLASARLGAVHSVVFWRVCGERACNPYR